MWSRSGIGSALAFGMTAASSSAEPAIGSLVPTAISVAPPSPNLAGTTGEVASAGNRDAPGPPMPFTQAIALLDTIPGVNQRGAELLVAEWGTDMSRFGTASCLSAWTGVAPGNDESAGKQRSGKTRKGNHTLRTGLTQIAHAAARTKGTYLSALYQRLAARRGSNGPS